MKLINYSLTIFLALVLTVYAYERKERPKDASLYIISPKDGETVSGKFKIQFGLAGMGVAPAGVKMPKTGHHHLLLDMKEMPNMDSPLPKSENLKHFGGGQTEAEIELKPGIHTLQLLLADENHVPHKNALLSKKIKIYVK